MTWEGTVPEAPKIWTIPLGEDAEKRYKANSPVLDVLTVYFPGPDNIAHTQGGTFPKKHDGFPTGPFLPEVDHPLLAAEKQVVISTDPQMKRIFDAVKASGHEYSTLFVLSVDHGLHAYHNTTSFNITLPNGMKTFFKGLGMTVWTNAFSIQDIDNADLVYSPSGGMAHIYIRNSGQQWNRPPSSGNIEKIARQLYVEAVGGTTTDPGTNAAVTYPVCTKTKTPKNSACYAGLYTGLAPKANAAKPFNGGPDFGALGDEPAIFAKLETNQLFQNETNIFDVDANVQDLVDDLNKALLSEELRAEYVDGGITHSTDAYIIILTRDVEWLVVEEEDNRTYRIEKVAGKLKFFITPNNFVQDYQWVKFVTASGVVKYGTIAEFIAARTTGGKYVDTTTGATDFNWPEFEKRIREMNDKNPLGSRAGDVIIFMDGRAGYLTVNKGDEDNGWHGGATAAESEVPMWFSMPGDVVETDFISNAIPAGTLGNWQLSSILENIVIGLRNVN